MHSRKSTYPDSYTSVERALGALVCVRQWLSRGMLCDRRKSDKEGAFAGMGIFWWRDMLCST